MLRSPKGFVWGGVGSLSVLRGLDGFIYQHSIIQDTNQDGFIQRAVDASNAYASIIEAVRKAEQAAHDADEAASEALMVRAVGSPVKMDKNQTPFLLTCVLCLRAESARAGARLSVWVSLSHPAADVCTSIFVCSQSQRLEFLFRVPCLFHRMSYQKTSGPSLEH